MKLSELLQIQPGVTAIIGSGGKTSLLYRLADELCGRVILTTSTHIYPSDTYKNFPNPTPEQLRDDWARVCLVGKPTGEGKWGPCDLSFAQLAALANYVLVEADGSRNLPLKAHAGWEPVIPSESNQTICVVGASGFNGPLDRVVHRPELWREPDTSPESAATMLNRENLADRIYVNQCETAETLSLAARLARRVSCPVVAGSLWNYEFTTL